MPRSLVSIVAAAGLALAAALPARAQPSDGLSLDLGYDGRLLFVKVLDVRLHEQVGRGEHASSVHIASYGVLEAFRRLHIDAEESGRIVHGDPEPGVFRHQNHDGKKNRQVEVVWAPGNVTTASSPAMTSFGDPPASREQRLGSVGYLTAALRLTVAADKGPCSGSQRIFNGKELSDIGLANPRPIALSAGQRALGLTHGVRCDASFREVAGYKKRKDGSPKPDRPIQVDFAQIGPGGPWVTARLTAHTILGPAVIQLARVGMAGQLPGVSSRPPGDSTRMVNRPNQLPYVVGNKG